MSNPPAVAIVSMGHVLPGAGRDTARLWSLIEAGRDTSRDVPDGRWVLPAERCVTASSEPAPDRVWNSRGYYLDPDSDADMASGDAGLDPLHRIVLAAGRDAATGSGHDSVDPTRAGVILGNLALPTELFSARVRRAALEGPLRRAGLSPEQLEASLPEVDQRNEMVTGLPAMLLSESLGIRGASYTLDAACASGLFSVALGAQALLRGELDLVLVGGASRPDPQFTQMGFAQLRALSRSGVCRPFDARADGLVVGEGAVVFGLRRLEDARREGLDVLAVLRGFGLSNDLDGRLLAPSSEGQLRAMRAAYARAGLSPAEVSLFECHATGTPIGDATELESLVELRRGTGAAPAALGAVKANLGHMLTGAGAAALAKAVLSLTHRRIPPVANFERTAHNTTLDGLYIPEQAEDWPAGRPLRAGVSGFGFGGTNAHLIIEADGGEGRAVSVGALAGNSEEAGDESLLAAAHVDPEVVVVGLGCRSVLGSTAPTLRHLFFGEREGGGEQGSPPQTPDKLEIPLGRFRVPPRELERATPQQLLSLLAADEARTCAEALEDADRSALWAATAVVWGIAQTPRAARYSIRWLIEAHAERWTQQLGIRDGAAWAKALADAHSAPLNADSTMGGLGSITASRIARELGCGGPSFTVSNEDASAMTALDVGVGLLSSEPSLQAAIVGGCDAGAGGCTDGAAALVVMRMSTAKRLGLPILASVTGVAQGTVPAHSSGELRLGKAAPTGRLGWSSADSLQIEHGIGMHRDGTQPRHRVDVARRLGGPGGASHSGTNALGLALAVAAVACSALPKSDDSEGAPRPLPWLSRRPPNAVRVVARTAGGARAQAGFASVGDGRLPDALHPRALLVAQEWVVGFAASSRDELAANLRRTAESVADSGLELGRLAKPLRESAGSGPVRLALVARTRDELLAQLRSACDQLDDGAAPAGPGRVYFCEQPLAGELALVYPGSGSQFPGMGADLCLAFPEVLARHLVDSPRLADQLQPRLSWELDRERQAQDVRGLLLAQVSLGAVVTDIAARCGIVPDAAVGYSLGETAALFSNRAWTEREQMLDRVSSTPLFGNELAGTYEAVRRQLDGERPLPETIEWVIGVVDKGAGDVMVATVDHPGAYLLIQNTPSQSVVGGLRDAVEGVASDLGVELSPLHGITAVHCVVVRQVEAEYRALHVLETTDVGVRFYRGVDGEPYRASQAACADSVTQQALFGVDFPRTIRRAYEDGVRVFLECGPGGSCTRMIGEILAGKPHLARSLCPGPDALSALRRTMADAFVHGVDVRFDVLDPPQGPRPSEPGATTRALEVAWAPVDVSVPAVPGRTPVAVRSAAVGFAPQPVAVAPAVAPVGRSQGERRPAPPRLAQSTKAVTPAPPGPEGKGWARQLLDVQAATAAAHAQFLALHERLAAAIGGVALPPMDAPAVWPSQPGPSGASNSPQMRPTPAASRDGVPRSLDRDACLAFARATIGEVLGPRYADIDAHPTRVRLPDEPLMLVDRILDIDAEPLSMEAGTLVTEHDVRAGLWYLDQGRIPTCVAVEAGQADLFLSAFLGIDHQTRGLAVYRLLDAVICFFGPLPRVDDVIRYTISIDGFMQQGDAWLFRFRFDADCHRPDGAVHRVMTMRDGVAGFFTQARLDAGDGIVRRAFDAPAATPADPFEPLAPRPDAAVTLDRQQLDTFRRGDLWGAFGTAFERCRVGRAVTIPGAEPGGRDERMRLVESISALEIDGGRFGLGRVRGEAGVEPDAWYLTCHFVDDMVMPGTLMYECCLHTLRVLLVRMGMVAEQGEACFEPVVGVQSRLRCRGQVLRSSKRVSYEIEIRERGYNPAPYVIVDALMYADDRPIVEIGNMSLQLSGADRSSLEAMWGEPDESPHGQHGQQAIYDYARILAFSDGKPSQAFGAPYEIFDPGHPGGRKIARLPRPPFQLLDRIVDVGGTPFEMTAGARCVAQFDVDPDAWYFEDHRHDEIAFAVLLEIGLQPCGWLAAYVGSALTSQTDLRFRNLGGSATLEAPVRRSDGPCILETAVTMTQVSASAGMIIQHYSLEITARRPSGDSTTVYRGTTYFGFFSADALATQVGMPEAALVEYEPGSRASGFESLVRLPDRAPHPSPRFAMVREIESVTVRGGPEGHGVVVGSISPDPEAWFFQAHFRDDPVWPGSLGLQAFAQLLGLYAEVRTGRDDLEFSTIEHGQPHEWVYRGQVLPSDDRVTVRIAITHFDADAGVVRGRGHLCVDGRTIYEMKTFGLNFHVRGGGN